MAEERGYVTFNCQKCLVPLRLDDSLHSIGEHTLAELTLPINSTPDVDIESQATSFDNYVHPCRLSDSANGANGFMLISDGEEICSLGKKLEVEAALFDTLSGHSKIDHPLCEECTDLLLDELEKQLKLAESDYNDFSQYLKKLEADVSEPSIADLQNELKSLQAEEEQYMAELRNKDEENKATLIALAEAEAEAQRLNQESNNFYKQFARHRYDYLTVEDDYRSLETQLRYINYQLEKLKKTNIFNVTFHIWHSGHFGTINNLRLGRLPTAPVDWSEINAAWGQTALLLNALARKLGFTFSKYQLVPYGNHSYIRVIDEQKELPLYGSGGFRFYFDPKIDSGMVAFLHCLQQFKEHVESGDRDFNLPYRMLRNGKIEDNNTSYSIKVQFNSEEQWTKALKFLLTNLKWITTWISTQFETENV